MGQCVATTLRSIRTVQKLKEYPQFQFPLPELVSHVEIRRQVPMFQNLQQIAVLLQKSLDGQKTQRCCSSTY